MDFYKSILILAALSLIIVLSIFGVKLSNMSNTQIYPANISTCPDYYSLVSGSCVTNGVIFNNKDLNCQKNDFQDYKYKSEGKGINSGLCAKKQWAVNCGVSWDGITNNSNICY